MKYPYAYNSAKAEGLRLQILSEEQGRGFNPVAIDTLRRAANMGDVDAAKIIAVLFMQTGNMQEALHWLKVADENGNIDATCILFDILFDLAASNGANRDDAKHYAQRIINAPYIESDFYKDHLSKATRYLLMAHFGYSNEPLDSFIGRIERLANDGDNLAQELMARFCTSRLLKKSSLAIAKKWYLLAAENGNVRAQNEYANLLLESWTEKTVFKDAFEWQEKAAEAGYSLAQFNLAGMYYVGEGVRRDVGKAVQWLRKAAEQCNACAMLDLSELLASGDGVPMDLEKSLELLKCAADCGEGSANLSLALRLLMRGDDADTLREAGYRFIVGHKICGVESKSDWRLASNQNRLADILTHVDWLKERIEKALSFYTRFPAELAQRILTLFRQRAAEYKQKIKNKAEGIVVNLHYIGPCNFKCKTCYFPCDTFMLKLESWKRIVDQIVSSVMVKRFNFAGGEPLLASTAFVQGLIDHIKSYGVEVSIITNGFCLTPEFIDRNNGKIDMIGISVDGTNEDINRQIGRATEKGEVLTNERLYELSDHIRAAGMRLKINTQVMKPTCNEDFHELICRVKPDKWKLLCTSIREDVNIDAKGFVTSEQEFNDFVERHKDLNPIVEKSQDIKNSYYMVFQYGEFVYVKGDSHKHLMPLMFGDVQESLSQMPHNKKGWDKRYGKRYSDER